MKVSTKRENIQTAIEAYTIKMHWFCTQNHPSKLFIMPEPTRTNVTASKTINSCNANSNLQNAISYLKILGQITYF